ncbi:MAG: hypothetical protein PUD40_01775 [Bacteroidales bacterium]|nr:hypothetical protein [Bacteroidales bacterium]
MKRILLSTIMVVLSIVSAKALGYDEARVRAWFLTDKMAYELNLTADQYDWTYQVNMEYFLSVNRPADCYGYYWQYRDMDMRYILRDWQYRLYASIDYFYRPLQWVRSAWYYPVCDYYRYGYYYFDRPTVYVTYHGGNWRHRGRHDASPYCHKKKHKGPGMRDRYDAGHKGGNPGYRPEAGGGRHEAHNGRYDNDRRGNSGPGRDNRNENAGKGNNRGNGNANHGNASNGGNRRGNDNANRGNTSNGGNRRGNDNANRGNASNGGKRDNNSGRGGSVSSSRNDRNTRTSRTDNRSGNASGGRNESGGRSFGR